MTTPNQIPTVVPRLEKETQVIEGFITSFHWDTGKKSGLMFLGRTHSWKDASGNQFKKTFNTKVRLKNNEAEYISSLWDWMKAQKKSNNNVSVLARVDAKWTSYDVDTGKVYGENNKPVFDTITLFEGRNVVCMNPSTRESFTHDKSIVPHITKVMQPIEGFVNGFVFDANSNEKSGLMFIAKTDSWKDANGHIQQKVYKAKVRLHGEDAQYIKYISDWIKDQRSNHNNNVAVTVRVNATWESYEFDTGKTYGTENKPVIEHRTYFSGSNVICMNHKTREYYGAGKPTFVEQPA